MNTKTNALSMVSKTGLTCPKEQPTNTRVYIGVIQGLWKRKWKVLLGVQGLGFRSFLVRWGCAVVPLGFF